MNRLYRSGLAALFSTAALSVTLAQNAPQTPQQQAEKAVKTRQGLFDVQAFAFGPVGAMLKGAPFDAALVQKEAARIRTTASMIPDVFQLDTHQFPVTTQTREGVWTHKSDFEQKAQNLQAAAAELEAAAKTGDRGTTLKAAEAVGKACGNCHDDYREKH